MDIKNSKIFSIFWLVAGLAWTIAVVRRVIVEDDIVGVIIYAVVAILSFILALAFYRNFVR